MWADQVDWVWTKRRGCRHADISLNAEAAMYNVDA